MIRQLELVDLNPHCYPTTPEIEANLKILLERLNAAQTAFGKQFVITSGLRSQALQQALIKAGKSTASKSKHLVGQAADVADATGELKIWINANISLMEQLGFWFEDFGSTKNWAHWQIAPYGSWTAGKSRFFIP